MYMAYHSNVSCLVLSGSWHTNTPGGGVLDLSLGRVVPPVPWNPDPVSDKKFVKILKNWYPAYDFQVKFHSVFRQNAWFLEPVHKKLSEIFEFETLFRSGRSKNHTLKGGTSPYSLCMGVPPSPDTHTYTHTHTQSWLRAWPMFMSSRFYLCHYACPVHLVTTFQTFLK